MHKAPTTFDSKGDADTWLALESSRVTRKEWEPEQAVPVERPLITFREFADAWLADRELTPRTRSEYRRLLTDLQAYFGDILVTDVTAQRVQQWFRAQDPATPTARAHRLALLKTVLSAAVEDETIPLAANPARAIRGYSRTKRQHVVKPASPAEIDMVAEHMPPKYALMVHLAAWCALRFGELAELRRSDITLPIAGDNEAIAILHVRRAVTWPKGLGPIVGAPKSEAGIRYVSVPPHLVPMLRDHLETYAQKGNNGLVFPNTNGEHLHHGSLYKVFKPARRAAGRPDLRWHDLRHTGATMVAQEGATLAELMARLGHSTVAAAMIYQHASQDRDRDLARRLSARVRDTH